ncbi:MAG: polymer-forming cytoskeletal protein [Hyphomonadaceae bacterium]|nr:polymer-forming cytoskeletal protein [Hyphomonadaceae bacterium]
MFTNKGKTPDTVPALPEQNASRRTPPSRLMTSIIANGVRIIGTVEAEGAELQVDGEIDGNVRGGSLTVGDTGMVKGDVVAENVLVNGRVEGSVRARKVQLARNAHVLGDITHQSLSVEMGAVFEGQCRYLQDPLNPTAGPGKSVTPQIAAAPSGDANGYYDQPGMVSGVVVTGAQN